MDILKRLQEHSRNIPEQPAIVSETEQLNYRQLEEYSNALASYLTASYGKSKEPIVVYGHKNVFMIVCFLACVKAGRGYCPIDVSVPAERAAAIINEARPPVVLMPENAKFMAGDSETINLSQIQAICREGDAGPDADAWVKDGDTFYIIFTSGSSGTPKGVKISLGCLNHFLDWAVELGIPSKEKRGSTFLNQAPFSFDLSVMDLYTCLACGGNAVGDDKRGAGGLSEDVQAYGGLRRQGVGVYAIFCRCMPGGSEICTEIASIAPGIFVLRRDAYEQNGASIAGEIPQGSDCEYIWADGIYSGSYGSESGPGTGCK